MLSGDETENKPVKKPVQRKGKAEQEGKKAESRKRKPAAQQEPQADQLPELATTIDAPIVVPETVVVPATVLDDTAPIADAPLVPVAAAEAAAVEPVTAVEVTAVVPVAAVQAAAPVSYQTIVDAYSNYTRQSLDQTQSFFGRLATVRSLDKAIELQTEFAKQAYDGFVAEARKIRKLYSQLARQGLQHWEGLVARMISPR
jgi:hypothetical protein